MNFYRMCLSIFFDVKGIIFFYKEGGDNIVVVIGKYVYFVDVFFVIK